MIWLYHILSISQGNRRLTAYLKVHIPVTGHGEKHNTDTPTGGSRGSDRLPALAELLTPFHTVITTTLNLRKDDKPWKIATPASGTNMRSSTMPNLPGNKSSREHGTRYTRISTAPAQALQHLNYSIKSLWLSCLSFSMIPRTLVQVLTTSDTKATIALCVSLQCRA